jgi:hypothetical protein
MPVESVVYSVRPRVVLVWTEKETSPTTPPAGDSIPLSSDGHRIRELDAYTFDSTPALSSIAPARQVPVHWEQ